MTFSHALLKAFFRRPYQYLEEAAPDSGKWLKEQFPLTYFYLSGRPINNLIRHLVTDAFIISYPKCGRTWLRLMIGKYLSDRFNIEQQNLMNLKDLSKKQDRIPRLKMTHDDDPHYRTARTLSTRKEEYANKTVLFLVRDPRDVIVSRFHHVRSREGRRDRAKSLSHFIRNEPDGFRTILKYYNIWLSNAGVPDEFVLVRYEDMQEDTGRELERALLGIGLSDIDTDLVSAAVEYARFDRMREMEENEEIESGALQKGEEDREEAYKTRKGEVGGFREEVPNDVIDWMNHMMSEELDPEFGYS